MYTLTPLEAATRLTMMGLQKGVDYSYLDVDLYSEGARDDKLFVVLCDRKQYTFNTAFEAARFFTLLVDRLRP